MVLNIEYLCYMLCTSFVLFKCKHVYRIEKLSFFFFFEKSKVEIAFIYIFFHFENRKRRMGNWRNKNCRIEVNGCLVILCIVKDDTRIAIVLGWHHRVALIIQK